MTEAIYLSEAYVPNQSKLITDFLLGGTLALLGQVTTHQRKTSTQFTCAHCQRSSLPDRLSVIAP
ncbi:hypothetical protein ACVCL3_13505 [Rhodanobacter sp. UC4437_H4]|jgi:hypothetical protein|uniref:Uncharacterized protein n=2 Tax=unclassified Rhodanobacter TaxID=2621553 RepID=A0AB74V5C8_9GAMM